MRQFNVTFDLLELEMDFRSERSSYTPIDFMEWEESSSLSLSPKFQRRHVWSTSARSYLIDTLLLGMPVPPIYMRVVQDAQRERVVREVVDGQQRISAILDYVKDDYSLSKNIETPYSGKKFSALPSEAQDRILRYSFICEVFYGVEDKVVLSIFARLNTHSVKLNAQELRNGRYFGHFKRLSFALAFEHLEFWKSNRIFTDSRIARMAEVELTSELLICGLDGMQDKKKSIDDFYSEYDDEFPGRDLAERRFETTIDYISRSCGDVLAESEFRRPPMFYSLFCAVYHRLYGLHNFDYPTSKSGRISARQMEDIEQAVRRLSEVLRFARVESEDDVPRRLRTFVSACLRQTDNIRPRTTRLQTICQHAFG